MPRAGKKILFVCTGNSCRSVMAEGWMEHLLKEKGRSDVQVLSAGTSPLPGSPPTRETVEVMAEEGIDVSGHLSQALTREVVLHADAVFCMEDFHKEMVLMLVPQAASKVHLLKTFQSPVKQADPNIPDPIGRPKEVYEVCRRTIREALERVMKWLEEQG